MADDEKKSPTFNQFFRAVTRRGNGATKGPFPYQTRLAEGGPPEVLLARRRTPLRTRTPRHRDGD